MPCVQRDPHARLSACPTDNSLASSSSVIAITDSSSHWSPVDITKHSKGTPVCCGSGQTHQHRCSAAVPFLHAYTHSCTRPTRCCGSSWALESWMQQRGCARPGLTSWPMMLSMLRCACQAALSCCSASWSSLPNASKTCTTGTFGSLQAVSGPSSTTCSGCSAGACVYVCACVCVDTCTGLC